MRTDRLLVIAWMLAAGMTTSACERTPDTPDVAATARPAPAAAPASSAVPAPAAAPRIVVHKTPTCGCCGAWVDHLRRAGFVVDVRDADDLGPVKQRVGVPYGKGSCHTAEVDGYFIEGHVPAEDIRRLLQERPPAKGLVLPGMPAGSPGMEMPDGRVDPYTVELVTPSGATVPYARHGGTT